jgi:hypothetical protein
MIREARLQVPDDNWGGRRNMSILSRVFCVAAAAILAVSVAGAKPGAAAEDSQGALVIVFKNGLQQTFPLQEVLRIEFSAPAPGASIRGRGRCQGQWKVGDGIGGTFLVTLKPDGAASKTLGSSHGTWTVVDGEARIRLGRWLARCHTQGRRQVPEGGLFARHDVHRQTRECRGGDIH